MATIYGGLVGKGGGKLECKRIEEGGLNFSASKLAGGGDSFQGGGK